MKKPNDIEKYVAGLLQDKRVQVELEKAFPNNYQEASGKFLKKEFKGIGGDAYNIILDLIQNDSSEVDSFDGQGYAGEFPITIYQFGPLFWISAQEFDDVGYFDTADDASSYAWDMWSSYV